MKRLDLIKAEDKRILAHVASLQGSAEWSFLWEWLKKTIDEHQEALVAATDIVEVHRLQGAIKALRGVQEGVEEAPSLIVKVRGNSPNTAPRLG